MSDRKLFYIYSNPGEGFVVCHGIGFRDFAGALEKPLNNLLLIRHDYDDGNYHAQSGFTYVGGEEIGRIAHEGINKDGDFSWVDFEDEKSLDLLKPQEVAEMLYFAHKGKPLGSAFSAKLKNRFAYCGRDDGWHTKIYLSELNDFLPVMSSAVLTAAASKCSLKKGALSAETARTLFGLTKNGLLIDGGDVSVTESQAEVTFYVAGEITNMDELLGKTQTYKKNASRKGILKFSRKA
jgi:hypothetical protein